MSTLPTVERSLFPPYPASIERTASRAASFVGVRTSLLVVLLAAPLAIGAVQPWAWGTMAVTAFLLFLLGLQPAPGRAASEFLVAALRARRFYFLLGDNPILRARDNGPHRHA